MPSESLGLVQGTVDVLILRTLSRETLHGYAISQWIKEKSGGALAVEDAALYQGLHRLERKGWVDAEWGISDNNRKAKFYKLTRSGRKQLEREAKEWNQTTAIVARFFAPVEDQS